MRAVNQKLRRAIEAEGRLARIEGLWWQFSLTERSDREPSAVSLLRVSRNRDGALELAGRSWQEDGTLSARYWSEAACEKKDPSGIFYYWKGERPLHPKLRSWKEPARFGSRPPSGRPATSRHAPTHRRK